MKTLEIINVGNGSKEYPGNFTKKEKEIIKKYLDGNSLNIFSGASKIGNVRIDLNHENATIRSDIFEFIEDNKNIEFLNSFNSVIIDAPYNEKFAKKYSKIANMDYKNQFIIFASTKKTTQLFNFIKDIIKPTIIILKSWNYYIVKGYELEKGYLCYAGGYRKPTLLLIMKRK